MESKAVLEKGFLSLKQSGSEADAKGITSETYVTLLSKLFETIPSDRKSYLREQLQDTLAEESDNLSVQLPMKLRKRDTKIFQKEYEAKKLSAKSRTESQKDWETITEHFNKRKSPMNSFERYPGRSSSPKKLEEGYFTGNATKSSMK